MNDETGTVVAINGETVTVSMIRSEACAKCGACAPGLSSKEMRLSADNLCGAKLGDRVRVALDDGSFFLSALVMYGIPLGLMLIGFILGGTALAPVFGYVNPQIISFLSGVAMLVISYFVIRRVSKLFTGKKFVPKAVEVVWRFE